MERVGDTGYKSQLDMTSTKIDANTLDSFYCPSFFGLIGNRATDTKRF